MSKLSVGSRLPETRLRATAAAAALMLCLPLGAAAIVAGSFDNRPKSGTSTVKIAKPAVYFSHLIQHRHG